MEKIIIYETNNKVGRGNGPHRKKIEQQVGGKILRFVMMDVYDETIEGMVDLSDKELEKALVNILDTNRGTTHTS